MASRAYFFFCLNLALAAFALALFCAAAVGASVTGVSSFVWEGTGLAATVPLGKGEDKGKEEEEEEEYEGGAVAVRGVGEEEEEEEERVGKGGWVDGRIESATNRPQKQPSHKQSSPHLHVASNPPLERRGRRVNGVNGGEVGRRVR